MPFRSRCKLPNRTGQNRICEKVETNASYLFRCVKNSSCKTVCRMSGLHLLDKGRSTGLFEESLGALEGLLHLCLWPFVPGISMPEIDNEQLKQRLFPSSMHTRRYACPDG